MKKSQVKFGSVQLSAIFIMLIIAIFMLSATNSGQSLQEVSVFSNREQYKTGEMIILTVNGNPYSDFCINVYDQSGRKVFPIGEPLWTTNQKGNHYFYLEGFSEEGQYKVITKFDGLDAETTFIVGNEVGTGKMNTIETTVSNEEKILPEDEYIESVQHDIDIPLHAQEQITKTYGPAWTEECVEGRCTRSLMAGTYNMRDELGEYRPFNDLVKMRNENHGPGQFIQLDWWSNNVSIDPYVVISSRKFEDIPYSMNFSTIIKNLEGSYKWSYKFNNVAGLESIGLTIGSYNGLEVIDNDTILIGEIEIDLSDLYNYTCDENDNCTTSGIIVKTTQLDRNTADVRISNFYGTEVLLDPTVQLQTAGTQNLADSHVRTGSNQDNNNYGSDADIRVRSRSGFQMRTYIKFDLSSIPVGAVIQDSKLCLYLYSDGTTPSAAAYHVYDYTWTEGGITWNNQPCGTGFDNSGNCNLTAENSQATSGTGWKCWSVTSMVGAQLSSGGSNISIALKTAETSGNVGDDRFYSKEYNTDTSLRPYLNITYETPPAITIESPLNKSYNANWVYANASLDKAGSWCGVSLNGNSNITMQNDSSTHFYYNLSGLSEDSNYVIFSCNSTLGLMNSTVARYFTIDFTPPEYSGVLQAPENPVYGQDVTLNSTWTDNSVGVSAVIFRSNYTGSWANYTADEHCAIEGNNYSCTILSSYLSAGAVVGWNFWANDSADNWNTTMPAQSFTVQKAPTQISLFLNGTDSDRNYESGDTANFTAVVSVEGFSVEIWANFSGVMQNVSNSPGPSPLTNLTDTGSFSLGSVFNITAYFSGNENYTESMTSHVMKILEDGRKPSITDVSAIPQSGGFGRYVAITANVTDNVEVDTVILNITLPDESSVEYLMDNYTADIYSYVYTPWKKGTYSYYVWANDTYGNWQDFSDYFDAEGSAFLGVAAMQIDYNPNNYVNLSPASVWNSGDIEQGTRDIRQDESILNATFESGTEGFVFQPDLYQSTNNPTEVSGNREENQYCASGFCIHVDLNTNPDDSSGPWSGGWNVSFNVTGSPDLVRIKFDYTILATQFCDSGDCVRLYYRSLTTDSDVLGGEVCGTSPNGASDYVSSGSITYDAELQDGEYHFDVGAWLNNVNQDNEQGDAWIDNFEIILINSTPRNNSASDWFNYTEIGSNAVSNANMLKIDLEMDSYNASGSIAASNNYPDIEMGIWNGESYSTGYYCNASDYYGSGGDSDWNCTMYITNSSIADIWSEPSERMIAVRGINLDSENGYSDSLVWKGLYISIYNGSILFNHGNENVSGHLLMQVQTNASGSWSNVETIVNDAQLPVIRNVSSGEYIDISPAWNSDPWFTGSSPTGQYRIYAALTDGSGNTIYSDDGSPINNTYDFRITMFGDISAAPNTTGYGRTVHISAEVLDSGKDSVYVFIKRPGESYAGYPMECTGSSCIYNYTNTWKRGDYSYYIWYNITGGQSYSGDVYEFYIRANTSISVKTENETYGPQEDVNLEGNESMWWDGSYRYSKRLNITNNNESLLMESGYSVKLVLDTASLVSLERLQEDGDDLRVAWYNLSNSSWIEADRINETNFNSLSTEIWFETMENISASGYDDNYYMYYSNPSAENPPDNRSKVYLWWDDFSENTLSAYSQEKWVDIHGDDYTTPSYDAVNKRVSFDTGDNIASDMYPIGVTAMDFVLEGEFYITGSYPTNATITFIGRLENPGTSSTHYYFDYSAQSLYSSPGISVDTWTLGERNHLVYDEDMDYYFPWNKLHNVKYAIYGPVHKLWINKEVTEVPDLYATDTRHISEGRVGFAPAQAIGWLDNLKLRRFVGTDPSVSLGEEMDFYTSRIYNNGTTDISGYLEMRVQRYIGGSWINFEPAFVNDRYSPATMRNISSGEIFMLDSIWNPSGWDTDLHTAGQYRAYARLTDNLGTTLVNDMGSPIHGWYNFDLISSYIEFSSIKHENEFTYSINEYETGDNIDWINVTVINRNATSINAAMGLSVLDSGSGSVSWGPQNEVEYCGNLAVDETCERKFSNSSEGYSIPLDAVSGGYTFYWNVTMSSDSGSTTYNNSMSFSLHHVPDNMDSFLEPGKIFQNRSAIYNLTLENPWSESLTGINVTINYNKSAGFIVVCSDTGLPYCTLDSMTGGSAYNFSFNITADNTPSGDYDFNATINYTNPGMEIREWEGQQNRLLMVRIPGQFVVIDSYPSHIIRNETGNLSGYSNNTLGSSMHNVSLYWNLTYGWSNLTGNLAVVDEEQIAEELVWNNITAYVNMSSSLGPQTFQLRSTSDEGYEDWDSGTVTIYARTYINSLASNDTVPARGDYIRISGYLLLDNGTGASGRNVSLYDQTDSVSLGSGITSGTGFFYADYMIPAGASMGNHVVNASFSGGGYYLGTYNITNITVNDKPVITSVSDAPDPRGYGYNISIEANVTDIQGLDTVKVCIAPPSEGFSCHDMENATNDLYTYDYPDTWKYGDYSYYIWANNTATKVVTSPTYNFHVGVNVSFSVKTIQDSYGPNQVVNITPVSTWWNYSWDYRRQINVTENNNSQLTGYVINVTMDTQSLISAGKMQPDCDDIRAVQGNSLVNYSVKSPTCNTDSTLIEISIDLQAGSYDDDIYIYYGNAKAENSETISGYSSDAGTVLLYHFTEGSGDTVYDYSGNGNNASLIRGPSWTTDSKFGDYAIYLPGDNEYIEEGVSMNINAGTLEMWFKLDSDFNSSSSYSMGLFGIWSTASNHAYVSLCGSDRIDVNCSTGGLMFKTETPSTGIDFCASNKTSWTAGEWYHLAVTWNGSIRNIYINGELNSSCSDNGIANIGANNLLIGAAKIAEITDDPIKYFKGVIDEVRGSNVSRAPTEFLSRQYEPTVSFVGSEQDYLNQSIIYNDYTSDAKGYLFMKVQRYSEGSWTDVAGGSVVSDSTPREILNMTYVELDSIWNGPGEGSGWNTLKEPKGTYRIFAYLGDASGSMLKDDSGSSIFTTYNFTIADPPSIVELTGISIYDVTEASDMFTDTSMLADYGINKTFNLYTEKIYRVEVNAWVNDSSTSPWTISPYSTVYHQNLDLFWTVDNDTEIWYSNSTSNYTGGTWSLEKIKWDTSQGNMTVPIGSNATFHYIVNISTIVGDEYHVEFIINDTDFIVTDYSVLNVIFSEGEPPQIYNGIYGLTDYHINRGNSFTAFARWNENIKNATAEYNSTSASLLTREIQGPYTNYWTNHTISTNSSWLLGSHSLKIRASDLNDNWNETLEYIMFEIWGWASVSESYLNQTTVIQGSPVTMSCRVVSDNGSSLSGYNVSFHSSTEFFGINQTNSTGWATLSFIDSTLGYENITCNITDYAGIFYNASADSYSSKTLRTIEMQPPYYYNDMQNVSLVHKGDSILYEAYWVDNDMVDYAWLSTNETGTFENSSLSPLQEVRLDEALTQFYVTIPISMSPGYLGWIIYANDSSSNINGTLMNITEVWGWAEVGDSSLAPNTIYEGDSVIFGCRVRDANGTAMSGYNVSFYNSTDFLGINQTNSTGWAMWNYTDYTNGTENLVCNITDYTEIMYHASAENSKTEILITKKYGEDIIPPYAVEYEINTTSIYKGGSVFIYALWNDTIGNSYTTYNGTSSALIGYTTQTVSGNYTNHTINTNSSWIASLHYVKINASDTAIPPNWNNSLLYKTFAVWGRSKVEWTGPSGNQYRGEIPLTCRVYDKENNQGIGGQRVDFYDNDWVYMNSGDTNSTGHATINWNAQAEDAGPQTLRCTITSNSTAYYNTTTPDNSASGSITLFGRLNVTITYPINASSYNVGSTLILNSTTRDENMAIVTPDTANWTNTTDYISAGQNTTWFMPLTHSIGPEIIKINVSKQYYDFNASNITIFVWGWSNVTWISPISGEYSQGASIDLICQVKNANSSAGIEGYTVNFYVYNSTDAYDLGSSLTNSTGYSVKTWNSAGYSEGIYYPKCNITNSAELYYNVTPAYQANDTINISGAVARLEVSLITPPTLPGDGESNLSVGYLVGKDRYFVINATATCRDGNCGNVQGTLQYNQTGESPDTIIPISYSVTHPFFTDDGTNPRTCSSNLLQDQSCNVSFRVNSSGALNTIWKLNVKFNSSATPDNTTSNTSIQIGRVLIMDVLFDAIDFGFFDPNTTGNPAPGNALGSYVISVDNNSNDISGGIWKMGTDLINSTLPNIIGVSNMTMCTVDNFAGCNSENRLNSSYTLLQNQNYVSPGTNVTSYFWIDIPGGIYAGEYSGTIYIKSNTTD